MEDSQRETDGWQRQDEEARMQETLSVLHAAETRPLTLEERSFLASESGVWFEWYQRIKEAA